MQKHGVNPLQAVLYFVLYPTASTRSAKEKCHRTIQNISCWHWISFLICCARPKRFVQTSLLFCGQPQAFLLAPFGTSSCLTLCSAKSAIERKQERTEIVWGETERRLLLTPWRAGAPLCALPGLCFGWGDLSSGCGWLYHPRLWDVSGLCQNDLVYWILIDFCI